MSENRGFRIRVTSPSISGVSLIEDGAAPSQAENAGGAQEDA